MQSARAQRLAGRIIHSVSAMASLEGLRAIRIEAAATMLPHPEKANTGGEDAFFVQNNVFGVFDGVGSWASHGVDAGAFSRALSAGTASRLPERVGHSSYSVLELEKALEASLSQVSVLGSCTACMLCVDCSSSTLTALNLGDSGFRLFRQLDSEAGAPRLEMGSRSQQHFFNCPVQLGGGRADRPRNWDRYTHAVQPGDLIVLATDGLFDNLFDDEIGALLAKGGTIEQLSERVASTARKVSFDMKRRSPFTVEARAQGYNMLGGKVDDVTVVLIRVLNGDGPGGAQDEDEDARSRRMSNELRSKL